jgi:hypothetical protein
MDKYIIRLDNYVEKYGNICQYNWKYSYKILLSFLASIYLATQLHVNPMNMAMKQSVINFS